MGPYSIGIDFGTLEARAILADMNGTCIRSVSCPYSHGVMWECLPCGKKLEAGFALQHPQDYIEALDEMLPALAEGFAKDIIGIGIDFTQCTMMPVDKKGTPLCFREEFQENPYAYVKLWKHHGAQPQAEKLTAAARERKEKFLGFCGGEIYAEAMLPKMLETFEKAPEIYEAAESFIELADWMTFYLTDSPKRSISIAGCAAGWNPEWGYPSRDYLEAAAPGFGGAAEKLTEDLVPVGQPVGYLSREKARRFGLPEGLPVAAGLGDCQSAFVGAGICEEGSLLTVMGTSSCDMLVSSQAKAIPGMYGVSYSSMLPGLYGYEAGQATMGDLFRWFREHWVPAEYFQKAREAGESIFDYLNDLAGQYQPGDTGLLALDWWNGNRSVLLDTDLSGMILGMGMDTRCEEIYLALAQALAFGKRRIVEQFRDYGIAVEKIYATGGVACKNPFLMQIFADVMGMPVYISEEENGSCLGSAVYGAAAGGKENGGESLLAAAKKMGSKIGRIYYPNQEKQKAYEELYQEYKILYQYFGKENPVMKRLKEFAKRGRKQ